MRTPTTRHDRRDYKTCGDSLVWWWFVLLLLLLLEVTCASYTHATTRHLRRHYCIIRTSYIRTSVLSYSNHRSISFQFESLLLTRSTCLKPAAKVSQFLCQFLVVILVAAAAAAADVGSFELFVF